MDFTREPLIETVITPKEGFKLIIRAISGNSQEEYIVAAVQVVSFGNCYFFRSLEKPKAFLLPMAEYEVVESRETRIVLKKPPVEKSIKIGGIKKTTPKKEKEEALQEEVKKRDKKRTRKKHSKEEKIESLQEEEKVSKTIEKKTSQQRRSLLPPPKCLISDQIDRYKNYLVEQGTLVSEEIEEIEGKIQDISKFGDDTPSSEEIFSENRVVDINTKTDLSTEDEET